jgi:nucleoside phosphorylase
LIRLVVALPAEARPLIRRYELARAAGGEFPVWRADGVALVVSGVGRHKAAAATAFLAAAEGPGEGASEAAWLNVGIAGHRSLPLGEAVLAHKVVSAAGGRAWYPPLLFEPPCATAAVITVGRPETSYPEDRPETSYPEEAAYDMEATGFCLAAARFASAELIQVVKVVSDNAAAPLDRLTAGGVEELIERRVEIVAGIAERTAALAGHPPGLR